MDRLTEERVAENNARFRQANERIQKIEPRSFSAAQGQELKLVGGGFDEDSAVLITPADAAAPTLLRTAKASVTESEIVVAIGPNELAEGEYVVRVANSPPGGGVSTAEPLVVNP